MDLHPARKRDRRRRVYAFLSGLLFALVALELALRAAGAVHTARSSADLRTKGTDSGAFVVLCLGDSFTYGAEAPRGRDYPRQLEELFARNCPGRRVIVVNRGVSCANSSVLLDHLPRLLETVRPDLVTVLVGWANDWNPYGMNRALRPRSRTEKIADAARSLRTVRLALLLARHFDSRVQSPLGPRREELQNPAPPEDESVYYSWSPWVGSFNPPKTVDGRSPESTGSYRLARESFERGQTLARAGRHREAAAEFLAGIGQNGWCGSNYLGYCNSTRLAGAPLEGIRLVQREIGRNPGFCDLYFVLAVAQSKAGFAREAAQTAFDAIRRFPDLRKPYDSLLILLGSLSDETLRRSIAADFGRLPVSSALMDEYRGHVVRLLDSGGSRDAQVRAWLLTDLEAMARLCRERGVMLLVQNYPVPHSAAPDLGRFAAQRRLLFTDQEKIFSALPDKDSYFAQSHCNERGYRLMAQNLFDTICAAGLFTPGVSVWKEP